MPQVRASNRFREFIEQYRKKLKVKNIEQALDAMLDRFQYLEDLGLKEANRPSGMDEALGFTKEESVLEWLEKHPCHYRTLFQKKGAWHLYCEDKKIPLEVCRTRQRRFVEFERKCYPRGLKKTPKRNPTAQRTKRFKDGDESRFNPDDDRIYRDDFGERF